MQAYDRIGSIYRTRRHTDPRIAARIERALGDARLVLNIGAGAGSYEPTSKALFAVEPSWTMIAQRPPQAASCVQAVAQALPFRDAAFDAAMGVLTVHHWLQLDRGLTEIKRACRGSIVLLTWDPECDDHFWLTRDYLPEVLEFDRARFPTFSRLRTLLGPLRIEPLAIPADCADGFRGAYWKRPEAYLNPQVQSTISSFSQLAPSVIERLASQLGADITSGEWARRNQQLHSLDELDLGYRIVISS